MELITKYYYFVNKRAQSLFLFWVKYWNPPLSKDLVRYIATEFFKVWVNPYKRLVELAVPHYGEMCKHVVDEFVSRCEQRKPSCEWIKEDKMLRLLMTEQFLGVEAFDLNNDVLKRVVYPNVVFANHKLGKLWIVKEWLGGISVDLDSPEIAKILKEEK